MSFVVSNTFPDDPAEIGWPSSFPLEIAMAERSIKEICQSYGIARTDWQRLILDPNFQNAVQEAYTLLQQEGAMFKAKIRAQAEGMLARNWQLVHSTTDSIPANVQADLIKFTVRAAGLDASIEQKARAQTNTNTNALQINLILGDN